MMDYFVTAFDSVRALTPLAVLLRTLVAALMGGIIGLERGMKNLLSKVNRETEKS